MSLQVCYCGWSKVTSYKGLRIHQGKMGCTPRGASIPQNQQVDFAMRFYSARPQVMFQEPFLIDDIFTQNTRGQSLARRDTQRSLALPEPPVTTQTSCPTPTVRRTAASVLDETPPTTTTSHQSSRSSDRVRRQLDFSASGGQVVSLLERPTTAAQDRRVQQMERREEEERRKEQRRQKELKDRKKADLQLKIRRAEHKILEVQSSAGACEDSLDAEMLLIDDVFSAMIQLVEEARRKALQPLRERKEEVREEAEDVVNDLLREIHLYEEAIREEDGGGVSPTHWDRFRERRNTDIDTSLSFGTLRATTSAMTHQIQQEVEELTAVELKRILTFAVDVRLDPTTAHRSLVVSADRKEVRDGGGCGTGGPDPSGGFDMFGSVLGTPGVASGRAYWEVQVGDKTGWDLGVASQQANRKGCLVLGPDTGYWVVVHYEGDKYAAMAAPPVSLRLTKKPRRVGVFVDYEEGLVSFYDVSAGSHICSFTECSFGGEIVPYFSPHSKQTKSNAAPLVICEPQLQ